MSEAENSEVVELDVLAVFSHPDDAELTAAGTLLKMKRLGYRTGVLDMTRVLQAAEAVTTSTPRDELVAEGRKLFRSTSMATAGESCQTCHTEGSATANLGTIPHPRADIANDFTGPRDAPALWGIAKTAPYFWNGDVLTLRWFVLIP